MLIFAAVLILVLWFCQIVYLEKIYKFIKEREVENTLSHISDIFEKSDGGKLVFTSDEETKKRKNNDNMDRIPPPQDKVSKEAADVSEAADG